MTFTESRQPKPKAKVCTVRAQTHCSVQSSPLVLALWRSPPFTDSIRMPCTSARRFSRDRCFCWHCNVRPLGRSASHAHVCDTLHSPIAQNILQYTRRDDSKRPLHISKCKHIHTYTSTGCSVEWPFRQTIVLRSPGNSKYVSVLVHFTLDWIALRMSVCLCVCLQAVAA